MVLTNYLSIRLLGKLFFAKRDLFVKSLFTNIPLEETIDIIANSLYLYNNSFLSFSINQFKKLLSFAVKNTLFLFNDKMYRQLDGVAMGSPLGPSFANIFLSHHEKQWLQNCPSDFKPTLYRRYIDDTFLLFRDPTHIGYIANKLIYNPK